MSILREKIMDLLLLSLLHFHTKPVFFCHGLRRTLGHLTDWPRKAIPWEATEIQQFTCKGIRARSRQVDVPLPSWVGPQLRWRHPFPVNWSCHDGLVLCLWGLLFLLFFLLLLLALLALEMSSQSPVHCSFQTTPPKPSTLPLEDHGW